MKNVRLPSRLLQYLVSTFTTVFFFTQLLVVGVVSVGACAGSTFPIFVANDKGDTKIFAFDYNLGANRLVIAG
jgi:hypothetical protein